MQFEIRLNGETTKVSACTVEALILELGLSGRAIAVERNREIVNRDQFAVTRLEQGDAVEIIQFVGGG